VSQGRQVIVSEHALQRYRERFAPWTSIKEATERIRELLNAAVPLTGVQRKLFRPRDYHAEHGGKILYFWHGPTSAVLVAEKVGKRPDMHYRVVTLYEYRPHGDESGRQGRRTRYLWKRKGRRRYRIIRWRQKKGAFEFAYTLEELDGKPRLIRPH
jgi:hypothetical protein